MPPPPPGTAFALPAALPPSFLLFFFFFFFAATICEGDADVERPSPRAPEARNGLKAEFAARRN